MNAKWQKQLLNNLHFIYKKSEEHFEQPSNELFGIFKESANHAGVPLFRLAFKSKEIVRNFCCLYLKIKKHSYAYHKQNVGINIYLYI